MARSKSTPVRRPGTLTVLPGKTVPKTVAPPRLVFGAPPRLIGPRPQARPHRRRPGAAALA